jgi:hypothetical protein
MGAQANPTLDSLDDETGKATLVPQGPGRWCWWWESDPHCIDFKFFCFCYLLELP